MTKNLKRSGERGFTLIELMIVVAIIGILAAIAIPKFADLIKKSQEGKTRGNMTAVRSALSIYYGDLEGIYPKDNLSSLTAGAKYLQGLPEVQVNSFDASSTGHVKNNTVTLIGEFITSTSAESGTWGYVNNNASQNWGTFWVYCVHNDSKGTNWNER